MFLDTSRTNIHEWGHLLYSDVHFDNRSASEIKHVV